jgi:hypothetical protein
MKIIQGKAVGLYNVDAECLLLGTNELLNAVEMSDMLQRDRHGILSLVHSWWHMKRKGIKAFTSGSSAAKFLSAVDSGRNVRTIILLK